MRLHHRLLLPLLLAAPSLAAAQERVPLGNTGNTDFTYQRLVKIANELVKILLEIAGFLAVGAVVYYGLRMAMSRDNASQFSEAKKGLWLALIGAAIIFGVYTIIATIQGGVQSIGGTSR